MIKTVGIVSLSSGILGNPLLSMSWKSASIVCGRWDCMCGFCRMH